jgi:hypothetical protein
MSEPSFINCLKPGCGSIAVYRGLCSRHYCQTRNDIRYGRTTWAREEEMGRCHRQKRGKDGLPPAAREARKRK